MQNNNENRDQEQRNLDKNPFADDFSDTESMSGDTIDQDQQDFESTEGPGSADTLNDQQGAPKNESKAWQIGSAITGAPTAMIGALVGAVTGTLTFLMKSAARWSGGTEYSKDQAKGQEAPKFNEVVRPQMQKGWGYGQAVLGWTGGLVAAAAAFLGKKTANWAKEDRETKAAVKDSRNVYKNVDKKEKLDNKIKDLQGKSAAEQNKIFGKMKNVEETRERYPEKMDKKLASIKDERAYKQIPAGTSVSPGATPRTSQPGKGQVR